MDNNEIPTEKLDNVAGAGLQEVATVNSIKIGSTSTSVNHLPQAPVPTPPVVKPLI